MQILFRIEPLPGGSFDFAKARWKSAWGEVESGWERKDGKTVFRVTVPPNCTALIRLPDGKETEVSAGSYEFTKE